MAITVEEWESDPKYTMNRISYYGVKLDCGHFVEKPRHIHDTGVPLSTGYGKDPLTGKKLCYECCTQQDNQRTILLGEGMFYLVKRDAITGPVYVVENWPGRQISGRVRILNRWTDNFGGHRVAFRCEFNGEIWTGSGPGVGMYCRIKRTKLKHL